MGRWGVPHLFSRSARGLNDPCGGPQRAVAPLAQHLVQLRRRLVPAVEQLVGGRRACRGATSRRKPSEHLPQHARRRAVAACAHRRARGGGALGALVGGDALLRGGRRGHRRREQPRRQHARWDRPRGRTRALREGARAATARLARGLPNRDHILQRARCHAWALARARIHRWSGRPARTALRRHVASPKNSYDCPTSTACARASRPSSAAACRARRPRTRECAI